MSDDEEHDEYMGAELYAAERHAEAAESLLRDAVIRADAAEKRVAVLEEALQFYADPETYLAIGFFPDPPCGKFMKDWSDTGEEYGFRPGKCARKALAATEGE